jgi:precorrin isomerase
VSYIKDGAEIYRRSFATIRAEADLGRFDPILERVVVRMIHACGMVDLAGDVEASDAFGARATEALNAGGAILCDTNMVASGVTRSRLPADNEVVCTLGFEGVVTMASALGTTRTAAAVELWRDWMPGALVVIGNAPTALFHLLEMLESDAVGVGPAGDIPPDAVGIGPAGDIPPQPAPRPAAVIGVPVGFIGAAESKAALAERAGALGLEYIVVHGRRGGSAIACGAINALASEAE